MKMAHRGPARGPSRLRKWAGGLSGRNFGVWMSKHGIKSGCGCTVGRDFTPRGGVRRKRCRERQVQKKVLNRVPLRGIKRRKPTITSGNEEAGITAAPTDTERWHEDPTSAETHWESYIPGKHNVLKFSCQEIVQFSSVAQSCPTLCNPMNRTTPGLPVHHQLLEFTQTHVHQVGDAIQPSHPLSSPSPPAPNPSQHQSFPVSQLFTWGGQSTGVSASASVLPKNTQDWSPLEWTGWISLKSKGLSRIFSNKQPLYPTSIKYIWHMI